MDEYLTVKATYKSGRIEETKVKKTKGPQNVKLKKITDALRNFPTVEKVEVIQPKEIHK